MSTEDRRSFLKKGGAAAAGALAGGMAAQAAEEKEGPKLPEELREYSRYRPSYGGPPDSDHYLGKLTPGLRDPSLPPVPVQMPDLGKIPWKMVNGAKEFHITCEHVSREFLPGKWMDVFGFNGSMPGPMIEANQGDRVRFVVHNKLPEPTSIHWHGLELPVHMDGVPFLTQDPIPPGKTFVYEFDLHQAGTFFYHSHFPMQEAFGMVGMFIIHPAVAFAPPVDRDFALIFQNFQVRENQTVADSMAMDWSWHTINGRSGPYTTPLVCKHGERIRVRLLDFSPMQHHPIHIHGHTFWITGHEGARIPKSGWIPRNNALVAVAQTTDFELVAFNPGDWIFHCHMVHHMMNHMVRQVGPRIRPGRSADDYRESLESRPRVDLERTSPKFDVPGYPQKMQGMEMSKEGMMKLWDRREVKGMRDMWQMGVHGLMTVLRVLPDDLYKRVMESDEMIPKGAIFDEIVKRKDKYFGKKEE